MLGVKELGDMLIDQFDPTSSVKVQKAITRILTSNGLSSLEAAEEAERLSIRVIQYLQERPRHELKFEFSQSDPFILIGKKRPRPSDSPEVIYSRKARDHVPEVIEAMRDLEPDEFEVLCALSLRESGAEEAFALRTGDEGGIDFFGRLRIRPYEAEVRPDILRSSILPKPLLVLGQAKRLSPDARIGREEIQKFAGQVNDCLGKYRGNPKPPKHRVPPIYYDENEPCLRIYMTTAAFSDRAPGSASMNGIFLVDGKELAEFLLFKKIGIEETNEGITFSPKVFRNWLRQREFEVDPRRISI